MAEKTISERLQAFETRIDQQKSKAARAQVEKEQAEQSLASARERLAEEFGAKTGADIARIRAELEEELETQLASIEADLEAAGA